MVKIIIFEGTPEEFLKVSHVLPHAAHTVDVSTDEKAAFREQSEVPPFREQVPPLDPADITVEQAMHVIQRRPISPKLRKVLEELSSCGERGLPYSDLLRRTGMEGQELGGVLGAFGRRIANSFRSKRLSMQKHFIEAYLDDRGEWWYRLTPTAKKALQQFKSG